MPTWKGMFDVRRVSVAVVVTLVPFCTLSVAGAATTTTSSGTTPTTVKAKAAKPPPAPPTTVKPKPPAAFALPTDFGLQLVLAQEQAQKDLSAAQLGLAPARREVSDAQHADTLAQQELKQLSASAQATAAKLDATRQHLRVVAARAYIHAGSADIAAAISSLMNAQSAVDIASQIHMITSYGSNEKDALEEYLELKKRVDRQVTWGCPSRTGPRRSWVSTCARRGSRSATGRCRASSKGRTCSRTGSRCT
jgi:hypothetical protein